MSEPLFRCAATTQSGSHTPCPPSSVHLCQFLAPESPLVPLDSHHSRPEDYISTYEPHKTPEVYSAALLAREKELADKFRDGRPYGSVLSRPWACKIDPKGLNAWLIWQAR